MSDHGTFYLNELMTRDPETAKKFYETTIGWSFDEMPMAEGGTYLLAKAGDRPAGGIFNTMGTDMESLPEHWFSYLAVDDIDACCAKAKAAGGKVARDPFDVPGRRSDRSDPATGGRHGRLDDADASASVVLPQVYGFLRDGWASSNT